MEEKKEHRCGRHMACVGCPDCKPSREQMLGEALQKVLIKVGVLRADADCDGGELVFAAEAFCKSPSVERVESAAKTVLYLRDTCTACSASLHGPEVDLEEGAPHCLDCSPTDEQKAEWLTAIRKAMSQFKPEEKNLKMEQMNLRLSKKDREMLDAVAKAHNLSMGATLRMLVKKEYDHLLNVEISLIPGER